MDVVFVASEMAPFSKTGGLGDVAGALPKALAARGHRVLAISPRYAPVPRSTELPFRTRVHLFGNNHDVGFRALDDGGVRWVLVDNACFHRAGIYGDRDGPYPDNLFRYVLLTRAALAIAAALTIGGTQLGERTVFHANDWHTALVPVVLDALYRPTGRFTRAATVLGLHNLGHHGSAPADRFPHLDLPPRWWPVLDMHGRLDPLKAGIVTADGLVAVSPTYAKQIQLDHGFGLEGLLRARTERLVGILNGIDSSWDPRTDPHIAARYDADDLRGKAICKAALQQELGLPVRAEVPLFGSVGRLDHQKGIDLLQKIAPWLLGHDVQMVMLGSGSPEHAAFVDSLARRWPDRARGIVGFSEPLAHRIEAGADVFLMPSRFEPCGLNQMYSMRYGTVPVVHATGGLADTVVNVDPSHDRGTGWAFPEMRPESFVQALDFALHTWFRFPETWRRVQRRGMTTDFSWDRSAALYESVYERVLTLRG